MRIFWNSRCTKRTFGVTGQSLNSENAKGWELTKRKGLRNETSRMGAHIVGMRNGDIILQIDDVQINV